MTRHEAKITKAALPDFKAALWDMDGTLVLSDMLHEKCIQQIGKETGMDISRDLCGRALGVSHRHAYDTITRELGPIPMSFEDWMIRELDLYMLQCSQIDAREQVMDVVAAFHARGIKQAIFSNNPGDYINETVKGFARFIDTPQSIFQTLVSLDDVPAKPAPDGYILAAKQLGVAPNECLVIEDSPTGVKAGKAAGCFTIYWPNPEMAVSRKPLEVQPDLIVDDLHALLA